MLAFLSGFSLAYHRPKVITKTETKKIYIEESNQDVATKACVANHGVPTYSAWDGTLNGCIQVGQSTRDSNKGDSR